MYGYLLFCTIASYSADLVLALRLFTWTNTKLLEENLEEFFALFAAISQASTHYLCALVALCGRPLSNGAIIGDTKQATALQHCKSLHTTMMQS